MLEALALPLKVLLWVIIVCLAITPVIALIMIVSAFREGSDK